MSNRDKKPENDSSDFVSQGKIISILMPSRGRPESLRDALRNITETCNDPNLVEILIRLDDDDTETLEIKDSLVKECVPINLRIIVGPRGGGYKTFHVLINELAASAKGDFLFLFNDDARIKTERWDQLILKERERMSIIQTRTPIPEGSNMFPIVHRKIVQILGHFSLNPHCDTWMKLLSEECGIRVDIEAIAIAHIRGQMKDTTYAETSSAYKTTSSSFFSPETTRIRHADTARILRYLVRCGRRLNIR